MLGITITNAKMPRSLDIDLVRTFVAVADRASMTAAANACALTQSAVSQQIKRLEDALACALFVRDRRGLRLTRGGEQLLPKARRLLHLNDDIWSDMAAAMVGGKVRVGAPYDLVGSVLSAALKAYADAYPQVEISLTCDSSPNLLEVLANGEVDLAVIEEPAANAGDACLTVERLLWVGAKGGGAHLRNPLPVSMVADTCAFRPAVLQALNEQGRAWRTVFESGNIEATTATVRADLAITAWLACTIPPDLSLLTTADGLPELPSFAISLYRPAHGMTAAATAMERYIRDRLARP